MIEYRIKYKDSTIITRATDLETLQARLLILRKRVNTHNSESFYIVKYSRRRDNSIEWVKV